MPQQPYQICLICERRSRKATIPLKSKPSLGSKRGAAEVTGGVAEVNADPSVLTARLLWLNKVMHLLSLDLMSSNRFWLSLPLSANHRSLLFPGDDIPVCFSWCITVGGLNSPALKSCEEEVEEMGVDATRGRFYDILHLRACFPI